MKLFKRLFRSKKSAEHALQELIADLKPALMEKLSAVIVFGSNASGEFEEGKSSVNVMILTSMLDREMLNRLTGPVHAWTEAGHEPPVFLRADEFAPMSRVLPIEFLDMADHHRVVHGLDPFQGFTVDSKCLGFQVEHDLNTLLLKLRRFAVLKESNQNVSAQILARAISSAFILCRALLRLNGQSGPLSKTDAARRLGAMAGFDAALVDRLDSFRRAPVSSETEKLFSDTLDWVEKLLHYARQRVAL